MNNNEIKKALYKESPTAFLKYIRMGVAYYSANIRHNDTTNMVVVFAVPVNDMGEADFTSEMEAKHLIRWIE